MYLTRAEAASEPIGADAIMSALWNNHRHWHMRAEEIRALSSDMRNAEAKGIMLRIAAHYDQLAEIALRGEGSLQEARPQQK